MAAELSVIEGGAAPKGSEKWANKIRKQAKALAKDLEEGYMEMAEMLWKIYDTPIDGDPKNAPVFTKWGYSSFNDYAHKELGIHYKKAQRLRKIWYNLEVRLGGKLPQETKNRLVALGFSKVRLIVSQLTSRNAEEWLDRAETLNLKDLEVLVRKFKEDKEAYISSKEEEAEGQEMSKLDTTPSTTYDKEEDDPLSGIAKESAEGDFASEAPVSQYVEDVIPVPPAEEMFRHNFALYKDQFDICEEAIDLAKNISGSQVKSNNYHFICLDFLASNVDGKTSKEKKLKKLVGLAKIFGYDLVVVDHGDVVFGIDTLEKLAGEE